MADDTNISGEGNVIKAEEVKPQGEPKHEEHREEKKEKPKKEDKKKIKEEKKVKNEDNKKEEKKLKEQEEVRKKLEKEAEELKAKIKKLKEEETKVVLEEAKLQEEGMKKFQKLIEACDNSEHPLTKSESDSLKDANQDVIQVTKQDNPEAQKKVADKVNKLKKEFYKKANSAKALQKFSVAKKGAHILDFAAEFIKAQAGIKIKGNAKGIREVLSEWAKSDSYLKDLSGTIEKEVMKSLGSFRSFVISYFGAIQIIINMIKVINEKIETKKQKGKERGKDIIDIGKGTSEFFETVLEMKEDFPKLPDNQKL